MTRQTRSRWLGAFAFLSAAVILILGITPALAANVTPPDQSGAATAPDQVAAATAPPEVVHVGAVPISVYEVNEENGTYFGDFYVWYRWKGEIDPNTTTEITNNVDKWAATRSNTYPAPKVLADGSKYQMYRLEGRFRNVFDISHFPLDSEVLTLSFENTKHPMSELIYQPDAPESLALDPGVEVEGWNIESWTARAYTHQYHTDFGDPGSDQDYSVATFELLLHRHVNYFFWKLLLPLVVVLLMALGSLLIAAKQVGVRVALPSTALLTAVFLQLAYSQGLPATGSLVLMDYIYIVAYTVLLVVTGRMIYTSYMAKRGKETQWSSRNGDLWTLGLLVALLAIGIPLVIVLV